MASPCQIAAEYIQYLEHDFHALPEQMYSALCNIDNSAHGVLTTSVILARTRSRRLIARLLFLLRRVTILSRAL